jgi:hypothetical protein
VGDLLRAAEARERRHRRADPGGTVMAQKAIRKSGVPPTLAAAQRAFVTEGTISSILSKHYRDARLPPAHCWVVASAAINNYIAKPWSDSDADQLSDIVLKRQEERKALNKAAAILAADMAKFPKQPAFDDFRGRWSEAIAVLRYQRGATDNKKDMLSVPMSPQGGSMRGHTYVARQIASYLVPVLMGPDYDTPVSVVSDTSPFIRSLREILGLIYAEEKLPTTKGLARSLLKVVDKLKKDCRRPPIRSK